MGAVVTIHYNTAVVLKGKVTFRHLGTESILTLMPLQASKAQHRVKPQLPRQGCCGTEYKCNSQGGLCSVI